MTERPILFRGPMVRAILNGRKTQTRRIVKPQPEESLWPIWQRFPHQSGCPFGAPGDRLWVRETHYVQSAGYIDGAGRLILYRASEPDAPCTWTRSIHMPRWASRITLEVEQVRVQRVQEISEEDARAEGIAEFSNSQGDVNYGLTVADCWERTARGAFGRLWDSLHGPGAWERNDWVRAGTFRRITEGSRG